MAIHPTAIIDPGALLDRSVDVGPYAIIEGNVRIGPETRIHAHAMVAEFTTLGCACQVYPFAVIGHLPQDQKFKNVPSYVRVGDGTIMREHVTIHRGTIEESCTEVGRECFLMAGAHIAHNCTVGDDVKMAPGSMLGGHASLGDHVFVSGVAGVHQFARVGEYCMVGGVSRITKDLPPFMMSVFDSVVGLNLVGLRRAGFTSEQRRELHECYRLLYRAGLSWTSAVERVGRIVRTEPGQRLLQFVQSPSKRGFMSGRNRWRADGPAE